MKLTPEQYQSVILDSRFSDIGPLPSQSIPYKGRMDTLFIRPFELPELRLLSKAAMISELGPLIRAVDLAISHDVYDLTIGDFYYVLLWLRMHSMPDTPYVLEWFCEQPFFTHKETKAPLFYTEENWPSADELRENYNAVLCETDNTSIVHQTNLEILCLEEDFQLEEGFDYPRVSILEALNAALLDNELSFLAPAIQWLPGTTWDEKMAAAEGPHGTNLIAKALKINKDVVHGISEDVTFMCRKCRVSHTQTLKLNALSFFR